METLTVKNFNFDIVEEIKTPKYVQLIDCLTNAIKQGKLRKGNKILSINEVATNIFYHVTL